MKRPKRLERIHAQHPQSRSPEMHALIHKRKIAELSDDVAVEHEADGRLVPFVDFGRWVAECECRAGIALDPDWPEARCFGCGAVYPASSIDWPEGWQGAEKRLVERPDQFTRAWLPPGKEALAAATGLPVQTASEIAEENRRRGVKERA